MTTLNTTIQKWGNSQGLRLKKEILSDANVSLGDSVKVSVVSGNIILTPMSKQKKVDLKKLLLKIPKNYSVKETGWCMSSGKEIW